MTPQKPHWKSRRAGAGVLSFAIAVGIAGAMLSGPAYAAKFTVFKTPWCGCCGNWVEGLRAKGHDVTVKDMQSLDAIKKLAGVPEDLQACHTASVDGYVVEGHVPAGDIARLLAERPKAAGIAVPGMPGGSLGMEGADPEPYNVVLFKTDGTTSIYARY